MRIHRVCGIALLLLCGCERGGEVAVQLGVSESWAGPALRAYGAESGAQVDRVRDVAAADVVWTRDLAAVLDAAAVGGLVPLGDEAASRVAAMVGPEGRWIGLSAYARVLAYDPERIPDDAAPTELLQLGRPELARQAVLADPTRGSASWQAAALAEAVGEARALEFYRSLVAAGARVVDSEAAVLDLLVEGERALALTDSDLALAAQERQPRLVVTVPDQRPDGMGTLLLPIAVALTRQGGADAAARRLVAQLLSAPVTLSLTLSGNQVLVLHDTQAPAGILRADDVRRMSAPYADLAARLPGIRAALAAIVPQG